MSNLIIPGVDFDLLEKQRKVLIGFETELPNSEGRIALQGVIDMLDTWSDEIYEASLSYYLVRLDLRIGEFEKTTHSIIKAEDEDKAGTYAVFAESHCTDQLEWGEGLQDASDDFGGMHYTVSRVDLIPEEEADVLKKYIFVCHYDQDDLDKAGDYKEKINADDE